MPPSLCAVCKTSRASILRPKNHQKLCQNCFFAAFETEIHNTILANTLFQRGEKIAIGASGGKDSTVLASVLKTLNERYDYGCEFILLSIDEGIKGYRDDSLETVKRNAKQYGMELCIVSYEELYGWSMDRVVETVGKKGNCTYCGVFRRQALDRGALKLGVGHVVTGHNCDDVAETVMMNCECVSWIELSALANAGVVLRGDLPRLSRSTNIITSTPSAAAKMSDKVSLTNIKRSKPLKYAYEKEIVLYAHYKKLDYFSTECIYSPEAFRGSARALIKNLERVRPSAILDIVRSGEDMARLVPGYEDSCKGDCGGLPTAAAEEEEGGCGSSAGRTAGGDMASMETMLTQSEEAERNGLETEVKIPKTDVVMLPSRTRKGKHQEMRKQPTKQTLGECEKCGYLSSQKVCKACMLLEGLNKNKPKISLDEHEAGAEKGTVKSTSIPAG